MEDYGRNTIDLITYAEGILSIPEGVPRHEQHKIDGPIMTYIKGCPRIAELTYSEEGEIWRHYTEREYLYKIAFTKIMKAGQVPYVRASHSAKTFYTDLTGIFLTKEMYTPQSVGVPSFCLALDVVLPVGTPIIKLEDKIFLVAMKPGSIIKVEIIDHEF